MPKIIPVRDLKDTTTISNLCHRTKGPIFITKNGYGDMVIMSMKTYEDTMGMVSELGNPDLFITFTGNRKWPEIEVSLKASVSCLIWY